MNQTTKNRPLLSVVTVVFNGDAYLKATIDSVARQTYSNIEYVVIDGGSSDGTLSLITDNSDVISHWVSEPDDGIYDAMNKALQLITGNYVWFLNAGDEIFDDATVEDIFSSDPADIYYGRTALNTGNILTRVLPAPKRLDWCDMHRGMVISHQSFIVKKDIAPKYDTQYKYIADYDWIIRCLKLSRKTKLVDIAFSRYLLGGFSDKHAVQLWSDRFQIAKRHFRGWRYFVQYYFWVLFLTKRFIKSVIRSS
jgi:glycosyltransferase involved in cell wall biosynthesis